MRSGEDEEGSQNRGQEMFTDAFFFSHHFSELFRDACLFQVASALMLFDKVFDERVEEKILFSFRRWESRYAQPFPVCRISV